MVKCIAMKILKYTDMYIKFVIYEFKEHVKVAVAGFRNNIICRFIFFTYAILAGLHYLCIE
jgi:hypothetical protein